MATTDGSIDYPELQDAFRDWLLAEAGLPLSASGIAQVYWEEEARKNESAYKAWGLLNILTDEALGVDDVRYADAAVPSPGAELEQVVGGNRLITVSVRVKARRDQRAIKAARYYLSRARTSLRDPQVRSTYFQPVGIGIVRVEPLQNLDFTEERRRVSLSNMDVRISYAVNRITTETHIETTEVSSDLKDPGGTSLPASLQLDDQVFP